MSETNELTEKYEELEKFINNQHDKKSGLISILHHAQQLFGYLPMDVQLFIARKIGIPSAKIYGVVSFYSYFTMEPKGKYVISVCMGTACFVRNAQRILTEFENKLGVKEGEMTEDKMFTLNSVRCVGACGLAPVVMINERVYGRVKVQDVKKIIEEITSKERQHA